jgi:hypothetical protein
MADLNKIAKVIDAFADYVDATESAKTAAATAARTARIDKIATLHATAHGEDFPEDARRKLASADEAALDIVENLLAKQGGVVTPLGAPADPETSIPSTTKEAAADADARFLGWIVS